MNDQDDQDDQDPPKKRPVILPATVDDLVDQPTHDQEQPI